MRLNRRNSVVNQINWTIAILLFSLAVLTAFSAKYIVEKTSEGYILEDLETKEHLLSQNLKTTELLNTQIDQKYDEILYIAAKGISSDLKNKKLADITSDELVQLSKKWGVNDITLVVPHELEFIFAQSSNPKEIGTITDEGWSFWRDAFRQVWNREPISIQYGHTFPDFWVGPVSDSNTLGGKEVYKFGYYYDGGTEFIVAPIIKAADLQKNDYTDILIKDMLQNRYIKDITVINVKPFLNPPQDIHDAKADVPLLNGTNPFSFEGEKKIIEELHANNRSALQIVDIPHEGEEHRYRKYYRKIPSSVDRMVMMVVDMEEYETFKTKVSVTILSFFFLAVLFIMLFVQWIIRRHLKPMQDITGHIEKVAKGDLTSRLSIPANNELGGLGDHLNEMTIKVSELMDQINKQAEEKVMFTQSTYHEELKKLLTSVKSIRHDFLNQMSVVSGLLQIGSADRALEYIKSMSQEVRQITEPLQIQNPELSVFLHSKMTIAQNNQISLDCDIQMDAFDLIPVIDQIRVYGNLIDNAIDEVLKYPMETRKIHIVMQNRDDHYYFRVENSGDEITPEQMKQLFELGFTTKRSSQDVHSRGNGLTIVKQTLEKYNGKIEVYRKGDMTCFEVVFPIG